MSKAYLTIDDGPTKNTKRIMDFLISKGITPTMSFYGEQIEKQRENGIYAIKKGAIIVNHSTTHPEFSKLDFDEAIYEIEHQEKLIDELYKDAEVKRQYKLIRFPYGDKGGKNKERLQEYLKENGFCRIDDRCITYDWYAENGLNKDYDVLWTFDFVEYRLEYDKTFKYSNVFDRINDKNPKEGGVLLGSDDLFNIVLIHDHEKTDEICPNYFENIINYVIDKGVEFVTPKFICK